MAREGSIVFNETDYSVVNTADNTTTVYTGSALLYGIFVNTVLSAHTVLITDGATTVLTLPASLAAGTNIVLPGIKFSTSLIVNPDDSSTGNITLLYRPLNVTTP
jgi:hypothetical protein